MNKGHPDVVIIGAGIAGCACAYYLAKRGVSVTVVDKGKLGYEQSTRNWGWVHQQVRYPHLIPLAMYSVALWRHLEDEVDANLEWRQGGNASLAFNHRDLQELKGVAEAAVGAGLDARMLSKNELAEFVPGLSDAVVGALHLPSDGQASPERVTRAFARAAAGLGACLQENCAALAIRWTRGRVTGVATEKGTIHAKRVLVAAGAWTTRLLRPLGLDFPQRCVRASVFRTDPVPSITALTGWGERFAFRQDRSGRFVLAGGISSVIDVDLDTFRHLGWFAPIAWENRRWLKVRAGGRLLRDLLALVPGSGERREYWQRRRTVDPSPLTGVSEHMLAQLRRVFPNLPELAVESSWAGYIDSTPDQAPVIGPAPGVDGLHVLSGLSGHGFALGPAAAAAQTDLLMDGTPEVDVYPFRFSRFAEDDVAWLRPVRR